MSAAMEMISKDQGNGKKLSLILYEMIDSLAPDARDMLIHELNLRLNGQRKTGIARDPQVELLADAWALYFEVLPPWERQWIMSNLEKSNSSERF